MSVSIEKRRKPKEVGKWPVPMLRVKGRLKYVLDGEAKEQFIKLYPKNPNYKMMKMFGLSSSTVQRFCRELGLKKNKKAILKIQAKTLKKTCTENGYYASLKGKRPSDACIEATKKLRAAGFSPILRLKELNPKKYKKALEKRSEERKNLVKMERLREEYGLKRKTKIKIVQNKITHNACTYKSYMVKKANYFSFRDNPFEVYYDSFTQRSEKMEATAARHGLRVLQGEE